MTNSTPASIPNVAAGETFDPTKPVTAFPTTFPISDLEHGRLQQRLDHLRERSRVAITSQSPALADGEIREAIEIIQCLRRTHTGAAKAKTPRGKKPAPTLDELLA